MRELRNNKLLLSKEGEISKNIYYKRFDEREELFKTMDYGDLKFIVNSSGLETDFSELKDPVAFLNSVKKCEILIEEARRKQK